MLYCNMQCHFKEHTMSKRNSIALVPAGASSLAMALPAVGNLDAYISAVNRLPMLSPERETELARRFRDDTDLAAARELVMSQAEARRSDIDELMDAIHDGLSAIIEDGGRVANAPLVARSAFALYYFALISWLGAGQDRGWCLRLLREQLANLIDGNKMDA